jgi:hypothetical protein
VIARDGQHVCDVLLFQPGAQRPVIPVDLIAGDPGERNLRGDGPLDHPPRELRLGRERHVRGDPGGRAAGRVAGPGLRQVQLPVNQRVPAPGRVPEVDGDLRVLDPPGGAGVLPLHADGGTAFLQVTGLVDHQHGPRIAEVLRNIAAYVIPHAVCVPLRARQQVLHPVRRGVPGMLSYRPAVLARQPGQQSHHERPRPAPRLYPAETGPDPGHQLIEYPRPADGVYAVASGHQTIITCQHKPG